MTNNASAVTASAAPRAGSGPSSAQAFFSASQPALTPIPLASGVTVGNPLVLQVASVPSAGPQAPHWSVYLQISGTLFIAGIAAWITWRMQNRQVDIARGALRTSENKLRLDLFDKRYAMFLAGRSLISDQHMLGVDTENTSSFTRMQALIEATVGASWLLDDQVEKFLKQVADGAVERYRDYQDRLRRNQPTWRELGWDSGEVEDRNERIKKDQAKLVSLFRPFMRIRHKSFFNEPDDQAVAFSRSSGGATDSQA